MRKFAVLLALACVALVSPPSFAEVAPAAPTLAAASPAGPATISLTKSELLDLLKSAQAAPVPAPAPAPKAAFTLPPVPVVDPSKVPDPMVDLGGFAAEFMKAVSARNWIMLIPLLLIAAVGFVRKFGSTWAGGFFTTPRGGAVLAIVCALGGSLYLSVQLGTTGVGAVLLMAGLIFVSAYPLFKLVGNLLSNEGAVPPVPPSVVVPVVASPPAENLAEAVASAEAAAKVAKGKTATDLMLEARK